MQNHLKVALIQTTLVWENPIQNRINLRDKIDEIPEPVDLIVLPEMFTTGFSMNPESIAESMDGVTVKWMTHIAKEKDVAIVGSCIIQDNKKFYNRLLFVEPNGKISSYDKRHTFTLAGEDKVYESGNHRLIVTYKGWKICPLVCYDLRFPVFARNTEDYDTLIYVANWPKVRISAWDTLLKARAIENMSYCIGVNRVGLDFNNYEYSGHSAAYDVLGERLDDIPHGKEATAIITLDKAHISKYRGKLGFLNDKDGFTLK
ncbi:amidohydrolase [uncultured Psychroserpens sp.]|uniref:amidohydrolase n=1 Tax=uncultured Psychroserpens sp. TaxID=255436 RepID=UPI0026204C0F|nr:amidohydrolase [uncultured Psychroserpens sp.]